MPRYSPSHPKVKVEKRPNGLFVGNVPVDIAPRQNRYGRKAKPHGPWLLTDETLLALGYKEWSDPFFDARLHFCRDCRMPFIGQHSALLCSPECVERANAVWREAHRYLPLPRPVSKAAQRRAKLADAACEVCGEPVPAKRLTARFCSNRCRQRHHREVPVAARSEAVMTAREGQ